MQPTTRCIHGHRMPCFDVEIAFIHLESDMGAKYGDDGDESGKLLL